MQSRTTRTKHHRRGLLALACLAALTPTAERAQAAERTWKQPVNGIFSFFSFWAEGVAPGASDNALFNNGSTPYTVGFSLGSPTTSSLSVLSARPTFSIPVGTTYTVTSSAYVGYNPGERGELTLIDNGTLNTASMTLGQFVRSEGIVTVGLGARLQANTLTLGSQGKGTVTVNPGTRIESGFINLGGAAGATGTLVVSGANATTDASVVIIGDGGGGVATVSGGAVVTSGASAQQSTTLGYESTGDGLLSVTGAGSLWSTRLLEVGRGGRGELDVDNGGGVIGGSLFLASDAAARGVVTVRGAGSALVITNAAKGAGYAQVNIDPGAAVYLEGGKTGKYQIPNTNLNGGTLNVSNLATPINFNAGTLQVTTATGLAIGPATVLGQSTVNADFAVPAAGMLQVTGQLNVAAGRRLSVNGAGTIEAGAAATDVSANAGTIDVLRGTLLIHNAFINQSGASLTAVGTDSLTFQGGLQNAGAVTLADAGVAGAVTNATSGTIFVADNATFAGKVVNNGMIVSGGSVSFNGGVTNNGTINVTGTQTTAPVASSFYTPGGIDGTGTFTVGAGAAAVAGYVTQQTLHVTDRGGLYLSHATAPVASVVKSLQLDAGGTIDLSNNALVIDYTAGASPLASVRSAILAGSLTSSALTSSTALGYAEASDVLRFANGAASDTFLGSPVDKNSVLVRYTLAGDANLDGVVDFNDLVKLAQNYNVSDGSRTWIGGDFNYDGNTDFNDLVKLAQNYNSALPGDSIAGAPAGFTADLARAFASVPEPSLALFSMVMLCGATRCRRGRKTTVTSAA